MLDLNRVGIGRSGGKLLRERDIDLHGAAGANGVAFREQRLPKGTAPMRSS